MEKTKQSQMGKRVKTFFNDYSIIIIFAAMVVILAIIKPQFIGPSNIISMVRQVSLIGILSMGMMLVCFYLQFNGRGRAKA